MKVTAFSSRYYKDELNKTNPETWDRIVHGLEDFNRVKFQMYDVWYLHKYPAGTRPDLLADQSLYDYARSLGINSLYANVLEPFVKGILQSQESNTKNYIEDLKQEISSICKKQVGVQDALKKKRLLKAAIVRFAKTGVWKKPYARCSIRIDRNGILTGWKIESCDYRVYERKVENDIRRLSARVGILGEAVRRRECRLKQLRTLPPKRAVFGSRRLYRQKDTVGNTQNWKQAFREARNRSAVISGRADSNCGNYIARYDYATRALTWKLPNGEAVQIPDLLPHTYQEQFLSIMERGCRTGSTGTPVAYTFEIRRDGSGKPFLLVKITFEYDGDPHKNESLETGCISFDINVDHLAWSDLDENGNQLDSGVIPMDLEGLSSTQAADRIGRAFRQLTTICAERKKPLVGENLDPASMQRDFKYNNPKRNRKISQFACERMRMCMFSQAARAGIGVFLVDPKYTSFIGKAVFLRSSGKSVHVNASRVIGLRALGLFPEVPAAYQNFLPEKYPEWAAGNPQKEYFCRWRAVYNACKNIPTHLFYRKLPEFQNSREVKAWIKECLGQEQNSEPVRT